MLDLAPKHIGAAAILVQRGAQQISKRGDQGKLCFKRKSLSRLMKSRSTVPNR